MRGAEERDFLFAKLFGYISVIRSGKLNQLNSSESVDIFSRLVELHNKRGWIREVTTEAILLLLESTSFTILSNDEVAGRLRTMLTVVTVADMSPWQLMLALGLQFCRDNAVGGNLGLIRSSELVEDEYFSPDGMEALRPVLLASTTGFPKVAISFIIELTFLLHRYIEFGITFWAAYLAWKRIEAYLQKGKP